MEGSNENANKGIQQEQEDISEQQLGNDNQVYKPQKHRISIMSMLKSKPQHQQKQEYNQHEIEKEEINYNDDDPLDIQQDGQQDESNSQKQNNYSQKLLNYNLEEGLKVEVKTEYKHFQFSSTKDQIFPVMVSISAAELKNQQQLEQVKEFDRPNIDLICVIDNSSSMKGRKINNVKRALQYMLTLLNKNDRICLITFNNKAIRLCNLTRVDEASKNLLQLNIDEIQAYGGTCINNGMKIAFKVLKDRQFKNQISSIFLLSDGLDHRAYSEVQLSLNKYQIPDCFTIDSFGFGDDHDAEMMNQICKLKDGSFYFIENIDQIDEFYCDALGGLFSAVAQEVTIEVKLNFAEKYKKFFENTKVSKTFGDSWKEIIKDDYYVINMNKLITGVSKDFVFELNIPAKSIQSIEDFERNAEVINVTFSAIPINSSYTTKFSKSSHLTLTLFQENEKVAEDAEIDSNVEYNYLRVQASEAMEEALSLYEKNQYESVEQTLVQMLNRISGSHKNIQSKLSLIQKDLQEFKDKSKPGTFDHKAKIKVLCGISGSMRQKGGRFLGSYSNSMQKKLISGSIQLKKQNEVSSMDKQKQQYNEIQEDDLERKKLTNLKGEEEEDGNEDEEEEQNEQYD